MLLIPVWIPEVLYDLFVLCRPFDIESQLKEARRKMEEDERNRDTEKVSKGLLHLDDFLVTSCELMNGDGVCRAATGFARFC